jgi:hypothetical protein
LGHAANNTENTACPLIPLELAYSPDHPLLGVVPHSTGVHQHDISPFRMGGTGVPLLKEHAEHEL